MKKVLVVCTTDSMIWNFLVPHIRVLQAKGIEVECACSRTGFYFEELVDSGLVLHQVPFERNPFRKSNIRAYKQLKELIKNNGYDVIHCHEPVGGALGRIAGKSNGKYVMYFAHGFHFFRKAPLIHWILYYFFEWFLSFFTDSLITICNEDYERAKRLHSKNVYLIPGIGVDFSKYDNVDRVLMRDKYREIFGIKKNDFVIISVGEMSERKNHRIILKAISEINRPDVKFILCGEGELQSELEKYASSLNIKDCFIMPGFRKDIPEILCAADVFVFPSKWEGLGLAGIEAMYSYLPVIGSDRQGIKDYVIDGKTGYLFEPSDASALADKIKLLMSSDEKRKELAANGHETVKRYSLDNSISAVEKIYTAEKLI